MKQDTRESTRCCTTSETFFKKLDFKNKYRKKHKLFFLPIAPTAERKFSVLFLFIFLLKQLRLHRPRKKKHYKNAI